MTSTLRTFSPADGSLYVERDFADDAKIADALERAAAAQGPWRETPLAERAALCSKAIDAFMDNRDAIAEEISWQMGRPIAQAPGERVHTGTWFMNRCDALDPALAWTGVKKSGRGCTLSALGYDHLTRPKSFHLKTKV